MASSEIRAGGIPESPHDPESGASSLSLDKDVAIKLVGEHAQEIDPEVEKRVLRKIDLFLIPAMIVGMTFLVTVYPDPGWSRSSLGRCLEIVLVNLRNLEPIMIYEMNITIIRLGLYFIEEID